MSELPRLSASSSSSSSSYSTVADSSTNVMVVAGSDAPLHSSHAPIESDVIMDGKSEAPMVEPVRLDWWTPHVKAATDLLAGRPCVLIGVAGTGRCTVVGAYCNWLKRTQQEYTVCSDDSSVGPLSGSGVPVVMTMHRTTEALAVLFKAKETQPWVLSIPWEPELSKDTTMSWPPHVRVHRFPHILHHSQAETLREKVDGVFNVLPRVSVSASTLS